MKKIMLVLFALLVFTLPFQQTYLETNAAIVSKAASKTAQKIAKEYIKDAAIMKAAGLAADTTKKLVNEPSRMQKEGYMLICMDYSYKPGDKCAKPANVKSHLTEVDKANIGKQAEIELDKSITSGKGMSKWAKFLDWFLPIWLVTAAFAALTYALDPDVKSLFDEVAYNTLVALGFITTVTDVSEAQPIEDVKTDGQGVPTTTPVDNPNFKSITKTDTNMYLGITRSGQTFQTQGTIIDTFPTTAYGTETEFSMHFGNSGYFMKTQFLRGSGGTMTFETSSPNVMPGPITWTLALDGRSIKTETTPVTTYQPSIRATSAEMGIDLIALKVNAIRTRLAYELNGFWYTDVLYNTTEGQIWLQMKTAGQPIQSFSTLYTGIHYGANANRQITQQIHLNQEFGKQILTPAYEEIADGTDYGSSYDDENGNIALLPPAAFTYIDETTGEQVERKAGPGGEGYVWQKPDGTQVPEENVVPKPEEEPKITPAPDGTPQYTPAPTPSNPTPQPEPLTPSPTPTPTNPPPAEPPPPVDPMPDGPSCAVGLKMPIFSPLKEQLSTSFPFSIPWDIERAAHAAFDGVGSEKPSFDMVIPVGEKMFKAKIETPAFLDKWKPFMDGFLLLTFDMLLMFGLYRFVKGAGS